MHEPLVPEDYDSCAASTSYKEVKAHGRHMKQILVLWLLEKPKHYRKACCLVKITMITCRILMQDNPTAARFATIRRCRKRTDKKRVEKSRRGEGMNIKTWYPSSPPVDQIAQRASHVEESYRPFHFLSQNYHRRFRDCR